jgi:hypothetical protein
LVEFNNYINFFDFNNYINFLPIIFCIIVFIDNNYFLNSFIFAQFKQSIKKPRGQSNHPAKGHVPDPGSQLGPAQRLHGGPEVGVVTGLGAVHHVEELVRLLLFCQMEQGANVSKIKI